MAKNRKKVFPKKPERLNSKTAEMLGKNSNKVCREANVIGIYLNDARIEEKKPVSGKKQRELDVLKRLTNRKKVDVWLGI